jgi:hypothetical protein
MELLLPEGATATVDERDVGGQRAITVDQFGSNQIQRVTIAVRFDDGSAATRLVDLEPGRHVRVPINLPPVDKPVAGMTDSPAPLLGAAFSPDGKRCATASEDHSVILWDLTAGRPVQSFAGHGGAVNSVAFSPDGERLLTSSADGTAILWAARTGKIIRRFKGHSGGVNSAVFSFDGSQILTGSSDKTAILWETAAGTQLRAFTNHTSDVLSVALSPDGRRIATGQALVGRSGGQAVLWNAGTGERLFSMRHRDSVSGIVFSSDGASLATSSFENAAYLWSTTNGQTIRRTKVVNLDLNGVGMSSDNRWIFTAGKDATVKMWSAETALMQREFTGHLSDVQSVVTSPGGQLLLTASRDGTARLFEIATGAELVCFASAHGGKSWAAVAPDGLFDASEQGRRLMGFRFAGKLPGATIGQFFGQFYRPGLLAEFLRGERPMAPTRLGRSLPPLLKLVAPKLRTTTEDEVIVAVDAEDQGGGVSAVALYNNDARIAVEPKTSREGKIVHYSFKLKLNRGVNQIRVNASSNDGSWEAVPAEIALSCSRRLDRQSRLFVVAIGISDYAQAELQLNCPGSDAQALADLLQRKGAGLHGRVDVIPLTGNDATSAKITETLTDVAALTEPHDTIALVLCGQGTLLGEQFYFAPQDLRFEKANREQALRTRGLALDELTAILGTAGAQKRVLILDAWNTAFVDARKKQTDFGLRGVVERWSRAQGIYIIASSELIRPPASKETVHGLLTRALLDSGEANSDDLLADSRNTVDVTEWFGAAARRAGALLAGLGLNPLNVQYSSQTKGFQLLAVER